MNRPVRGARAAALLIAMSRASTARGTQGVADTVIHDRLRARHATRW
jgi:hypothetical protein